jgi:NCAIR mutase (PurE)-related protein
MDELRLRRLLQGLVGGETSVDEAVRELRHLPYADLGFARVDHHRELRVGICEAVYGPGKTPEQAAAIALALLEGNTGPVLVTRAAKEQYEAVAAVVPEAVYHEVPRLIVARPAPPLDDSVVAVASAGTSDIPVAEEAAVTAEALGLEVERVRDVGVAGLHRVVGSLDVLERAGVVIVVAGMEGALASLVGGLVAAPVVAVPTSVGYGVGAGGIAPLLTMLNSCAPGVAVMNIDNGFGAAVFAAKLLRTGKRVPRDPQASDPPEPPEPPAAAP